MVESRLPGPAGEVSGKSRFDHIYNQPDPRAYFAKLAPLEYEIPHHAQPLFRRVAAERVAVADGHLGTPAVLDLCSSYGINAALLNHEVTLAQLVDRYTCRAVQNLSTDELAARDRDFYANRRRPDAVPVIGLDVANAAVDYARAVGLLDAAFTDDLEHTLPSPGLRKAMKNVGLITLTGGGSYITHRTFSTLLDSQCRPMWISAFVLRTVSYDGVISTLAEKGLQTAADASRTYSQRLFTGEPERQYAIRAVQALGHDPTGREETGRFHCVRFESRPALPGLPGTPTPH